MQGDRIIENALAITGGKGPLALVLKGEDWLVSDDTVLHLATAEGLAAAGEAARTHIKSTLKGIGACYKSGMEDMHNRAPGNGTMRSMDKVAADGTGWDTIPFTSRGGGGCGAAMRSMAIGLAFPSPDDLPWLVAYAVDSSRITHHSPLGWFGGAVAAFFTSLAVRRVPPVAWVAHILAHLVPAVTQHIVSTGRSVKQLKLLPREVSGWTAYAKSSGLPLTLKEVPEGASLAAQPRAQGWCDLTQEAALVRDAHYASIAPGRWPGGTGRGACLIAYDALLAAGPSYADLVTTAMLHGGDNDSTGAIAGAWWGALYGMEGVPSCHVEHLEYRARMEAGADAMLELSGLVATPAGAAAASSDEHK